MSIALYVSALTRPTPVWLPSLPSTMGGVSHGVDYPNTAVVTLTVLPDGTCTLSGSDDIEWITSRLSVPPTFDIGDEYEVQLSTTESTGNYEFTSITGTFDSYQALTTNRTWQWSLATNIILSREAIGACTVSIREIAKPANIATSELSIDIITAGYIP